MSTKRIRQHKRSAGGILFELVIACGLLAVIIAAVAQTGVAFINQQRRASMHEYAAREAANLLEIASVVPFDQLTAEELQNTALLSKMAESVLGGDVEWRVDDVSRAPEGLVGRRVEVALNWNFHGLPRTTTLRIWRFDNASSGEAEKP